MINVALAIAVGIVTVVALATVVIKGKGNEKGNEQAIRSNVDRFLDYLDSTREMRYSKGKGNRDRLLAQYDGFRHSWYAYEDEWACNFSMS